MNVLHIILSFWPSVRQKLATLIKIWRSSDKNKLEHFVDHLMYPSCAWILCSIVDESMSACNVATLNYDSRLYFVYAGFPLYRKRLPQQNVFTASKISRISVKFSQVINNSKMLRGNAVFSYRTRMTAFVLTGFINFQYPISPKVCFCTFWKKQNQH